MFYDNTDRLYTGIASEKIDFEKAANSLIEKMKNRLE